MGEPGCQVGAWAWGVAGELCTAGQVTRLPSGSGKTREPGHRLLGLRVLVKSFSPVDPDDVSPV